MRKLLLIIVGASICSLVFAEDDEDLFSELDSTVPVTESAPAVDAPATSEILNEGKAPQASEELSNNEASRDSEALDALDDSEVSETPTVSDAESAAALDSLAIAAPLAEETSFANQPWDSTNVLRSDPDYQVRDYYRRKKPERETKIPEPKDGERMTWLVGGRIRNLNVAAGDYNIIRVSEVSEGYHIRFVAKATSNGRHLRVLEAINEVMPGDYVVKENFTPIRVPNAGLNKSATNRSSKSLGEVFAILEPGQDAEVFFSGTRQLIGANFEDYKDGNAVSIGSAMTIKRKGELIAKAIVVDADRDLATLYVYETIREVRAEDKIFTQ